MSSTIENIQRRMESAVNGSADLAIPTPYTRLFNNGGVQVDMGTQEVTIEVYKGNRKVAPLVSRLVPGIDADRNAIRPGVAGANDYLYPLVSQDLEIPSNVLNKRVPGEDAYLTMGTSSEDRKRFRRQWWSVALSIDAASRVIRRDELLAKQSFFESRVALGDTFQSNTYLDFPRSATLKDRTVAVSWATAGSATPWKDIGDAQREAKAQSQVDGRNMWFMDLSSDTMENLRAIYRAQRAQEIEPELFYSYGFDPEQGAPAELAFKVENGMEYQGWIRSTFSSSKVHLFTLPEVYDATADDSAETTTDWISGETAALCLYNPGYFKSYYGPGILEPPENNIVEKAIGRVGVPNLTPAGLTIGASGIPTESMLLNIYELGRNQGFGATLEHAFIPAVKRPDVVVTIDTETTA